MSETKECGGCHQKKGRSFFSTSQWNAGPCRRCSACMHKKRPARTGGGKEIWRHTFKAHFFPTG